MRYLLLISSFLTCVSCNMPSQDVGGGVALSQFQRTQIQVKAHNLNSHAIAKAIIQVNAVQIRYKSIDGQTKWLTFPQVNHTIDLLQLSEESKKIIGRASIPNGSYDHVRLITANTGVVTHLDGTEENFDIPSGSKSGLKIFFQQEVLVQSGLFYLIDVEVDIDHSFVQHAKGYHFKPVLKADVSIYEEPVTPPGDMDDDSGDSNPDGSDDDSSDGGSNGSGDGTGGDFPIIGI